MNIQPPDYEKIEKELWLEYAKDVKSLLNNQDTKLPDRIKLLDRIQTFANRFDFDETEVCEKIKNDHMFAYHFAKNPTRTGFHEKKAGKYLQQCPKIQSFEFLPARGKNAKYMDKNGNVVTGKKPTDGSKSLDFMWIAGNTHITCFASHKFTREKGGTQNHQRDELIRLLQMFKVCNNTKIALFAICDGPYYNEEILSTLHQHVRTEPPYSFACPVGDVPKNVEKLIRDQVR